MNIRLFELTLYTELQIKEYRKSTFHVLLGYSKISIGASPMGGILWALRFVYNKFCNF